MVPYLFTRQRARPGRALLGVVVALLVAITAAAGAAVASASAANVDEPLSCAAMLDEATKQSLEAAGWELVDRSPQPGEDQFAFVDLGGTACMWGLPQSDAFTWIAYSRVTDAEAAAQQERLTGLGFSGSETPEGTLFQWTQPAGTPGTAPRADQVYLFSDGFWYLAGAAETLLEVRGNVMAALVVEETEPDPVEEPAPEFIVGLGSGEFNAPSTISSLATAQSLNLTPERVGVTAGIALVLVAIIGFPGKLVESALSANYDKLSRRLRPLTTPLRRVLVPMRTRVKRLPRWPLIGTGLVVAAIVSGFIDPQFGLNAGSVRMFVSVLLTLVVESVLALWLVSRLVRRRQPQLGPRFEFKIGSLVVLVVVVLASRATGFEPGMLFGVVLALGYATRPDSDLELRASAAEAGYLFVVGVASWVAYSVVAAAQGVVADAASVFLRETLGGLVIAALAALPIVLLPWRGLIGGVLYAWRRGAWFAAYSVAMLAFLIILMPLPESWAKVDIPIATWVAAYLAFAIASVAIWAVLTYGLSRPTREGVQSDQSTP